MYKPQELVEVVIKDPNNRIYVELSFIWSDIRIFWWFREENEDPIDTAIRELYDFYWIKFTKKDLKLVENTKDFKKNYIWINKSYLYTLKVSKEVMEIILANEYICGKAFKIEDLEWLNIFPFAMGGNVLQKIEKALEIT
jgi:hypothetical protein